MPARRRSFAGSGRAFDPAVPSTHSIQVKEAKLATDAGELPIVLRIWDFGGQDIYHGTHALPEIARRVPDRLVRGHHREGGA